MGGLCLSGVFGGINGMEGRSEEIMDGVDACFCFVYFTLL